MKRAGRLGIAVVVPALLLTGCSAPTNNGVTFLAEATALCADPSLTDALVGVGIEVHGSTSATIAQVSLDGTPAETPDTIWLLDAFPANRATAYPPTGIAGWQTRTTVDGASVSPGSHTIVVRIRQPQAGPSTAIHQVEISYAVDGRDGTSSSDVVIGFGSAGDHTCQ